MLTTLKAKLVTVGAIIMAVLAAFVRIQGLKNQRDKLAVKADTLEASAKAERTKKKIIKEEKKELSRRESVIKEKKGNVEKPEDLNDLFNNDDW